MASSNGTSTTTKPKASVPSEIGGTGLRQFGGVLYEEYLPALQGEAANRVYKEMGHDPIVGGMMLAIQNLVRRVEWQTDPSDTADEGDPAAEEAVNFVDGAINDMSKSFPDTMAMAFTDIQYGWSYLETVYKQRGGPQPDQPGAKPSSRFDDGKYGWRKWGIRGQDSLLRWQFDDNGGVQGMWQTLPDARGTVFVPIEVALLFNTGGEKDNPEGQSCLRTAYRPWYFKRRIEEIEAIGIERDAAGLPIAYVPSRYLDEDADEAMQATVAALDALVTGIRRNEREGLVFPRDWDEDHNPIFGIELMSAPGSRQINMDQVINRKNAEIAMCALTDWMLLGHEGVGSRALALPKIDLFTTILETWCKSKAAVINSHAIPRLFSLNGMDLKLCPTLRPSRVKQVDIKEFADTVSTLLNAHAITPDDDLEDHIREIADLPPRSPASMAAIPGSVAQQQPIGPDGLPIQPDPNAPNGAAPAQAPPTGSGQQITPNPQTAAQARAAGAPGGA